MESKLIPAHKSNFRNATFYHRRTAAQRGLIATYGQSSRIAGSTVFFAQTRLFPQGKMQ